MIPHWTVLFLCGYCVSTAVLILVLLAASLALIGFNDWYVIRRAAQRESSVEALEALFALDDNRAIDRLRPRRQR